MVRGLHLVLPLILTLSATIALAAAEPPRSARITCEAGSRYLAEGNNADAVDCFLRAVEIAPRYAQAHFLLGDTFLWKYRVTPLALHHFEKYLEIEPDGSQRQAVDRIVSDLKTRIPAQPLEDVAVLGAVGSRLLVCGVGERKRGDEIRVSLSAAQLEDSLVVEYAYPECVLTMRDRESELPSGF